MPCHRMRQRQAFNTAMLQFEKVATRLLVHSQRSGSTAEEALANGASSGAPASDDSHTPSVARVLRGAPRPLHTRSTRPSCPPSHSRAPLCSLTSPPFVPRLGRLLRHLRAPEHGGQGQPRAVGAHGSAAGADAPEPQPERQVRLPRGQHLWRYANGRLPAAVSTECPREKAAKRRVLEIFPLEKHQTG